MQLSGRSKKLRSKIVTTSPCGRAIWRWAGWLVPVLLLAGLGSADRALATPQRHVPGRILVRPNAQLVEADFEQRLARQGVRSNRRIPLNRVRLVEVAEDQVEATLTALRNDPAVEFAELDYLAEAAFLPNDPHLLSGEAWHVPRLQLPAAWEITAGAPGVIVAVLDSGVRASHPDLMGRLLPGHDFVNGDAEPNDEFGHGTAVTGAIVAAGNNGVGVAGVAFGARVLPVKVMDDFGFAAYSAIAEGIRYAVDQGARIINLSIAGSAPSLTLQSAIDYAWSNNVVVVAAAGNNGNNVLQYPAACARVLAVSATGADDLIAGFSSYGSHVSVCAPGVDIWTTQRSVLNPFGAWRGTSLASPLVAGVAALVASVNPQLSGDDIAEVLRQTTDDLGPAGYDAVYAHGRVNAARAVFAAVSLPGSAMPRDPLPPLVTLTQPAAALQRAPGESLSLQADAQPLSGSAVWIEFQANGRRLGEPQSTPATFNWTPLQAGVYALTAVAVDDHGARATSGPVTLTVLAPETTPPTATLTAAPRNGARLTEAMMTLAGTASDNVAVDRVEVSLNGGVFQAASGATDWTATLMLAPGNNVVQLRSVDTSGNVSPVIERHFVFVQLAELRIQTLGLGRVTPDLNGQRLEVGRTYTVRATPAKEHIFVGWQGVNETAAMVSFTMQEGLVLTAQFVASPFVPIKGNFNGLVVESAGVRPETAGAFTITLTSMGRFTGQLRLGDSRYALRGQFDLAGRAIVSVPRASLAPLTMVLELHLTGKAGQITGSLTDGAWTAAMEGERNVFHARLNPAPQAGAGEFLLERADAISPTPAAYGVNRIAASGKTRVAGRLQDGRKFTAANALAANGDYPFYLSLSAGQEVIIGWVNFPNAPHPTTSGTVVWVSAGTNAFAATLQAAAVR